MADVAPCYGLGRGVSVQRSARNRTCWGGDTVNQIKIHVGRGRLMLDRVEMMSSQLALDDQKRQLEVDDEQPFVGKVRNRRRL
jgi:hypothetical protein